MKSFALTVSLLSLTTLLACSEVAPISETENAINVLDGTPCLLDMETFVPLSNAYPDHACVTDKGHIIMSDEINNHECVLSPGCDVYLCCNSDEIDPIDAWNIDAPWAPNGPPPEGLLDGDDIKDYDVFEEEITQEDINDEPQTEPNEAPPVDDSPGLDEDLFPEIDVGDSVPLE